MHLRRLLLLFLLCALALALSGCIYLRLLQVKYQLNTFDGYVKIRNHDGLSLLFLKPLLLKEDILFLAGRHPTKAQESHHGTRWQYLFLKQLQGPEKECGDFNVMVGLLFQKNRLATVTLPQRFFENLTEPFIMASLKALGRSQINIKDRFAQSAVHGKDLWRSHNLPGKQDVLRLLGRPSREEMEDDLVVLTYRFRLKPGKGDEKKGPAYGWTQLTFQTPSETLLRAEARFAMVRLSMDFRDQATDKHPAPVALLPQTPPEP
jgi:hypothetical protein